LLQFKGKGVSKCPGSEYKIDFSKLFKPLWDGKMLVEQAEFELRDLADKGLHFPCLHEAVLGLDYLNR
jgi:hypothetical protein